MTTQEEMKLSMYNNIISLAKKNQSITFVMPAFGDSVTELGHIIDEITNTENTVRQNTDRNKLNRIIAADALIDSLRPVISALYLFSKDTSNIILKENVRIDELKLKNLGYADLLDKSNRILQWAKEEINPLLRYGINAGHIERLTEKLNLFKRELKSKEAGFDGENAVKINLHELFNEAEEIVNEEIDNFAEILRPLNPPFYRQYLELRSTAI